MKIIDYNLTAHYCDDEYPKMIDTELIKCDYEWLNGQDVSLIIQEDNIDDIDNDHFISDLFKIIGEGFTGFLLTHYVNDMNRDVINKFVFNQGKIDVYKFNPTYIGPIES
jgi:hypothetical protein